MEFFPILWNFIDMFILGKSCILHAIFNREIPIPEHIDIYLLQREMPAIDKTAIQAVIDVDTERLRLEKEAEELAACGDDDIIHEKLMDVYERLEEISADTAEVFNHFIWSHEKRVRVDFYDLFPIQIW